MRRDVYIENDSGGFSVLAADAVDAIIEDGREDDLRFVTGHKVLLLELYGDDSLPVRIVVDEPLTRDEQEQWLARATWRIDTSDGRLLVMGGFDPDVLGWWKEGAEGHADGRGVAAVMAEPGSWQVDVYAHVGSMNGRHIIHEAEERPGAAFRRSHPGRPFPLWLAKMLDLSGERDPGFEEHWQDVRASLAAGHLQIDTEGGDAIGFVVHFTRLSSAPEDAPEGGWFELDRNRRIPAIFPLGLISEAPDPNLRSFRNHLLNIREPEPERPIADRVVEIMEVWPGAPLKAIDSGPVPLPPSELYLLFWMAALTADATPRFELWLQPAGSWKPPVATPDFAVVTKSEGVIAIGPVQNTGGWHTWWTVRDVAHALANIPDGSALDLAMAPGLDLDDEGRPEVGRALYSGTVSSGEWQITEATPAVTRDVLEQALSFVRDLAVNGLLQVRRDDPVLSAALELSFVDEDALEWDADGFTLPDPDERALLMMAGPVFRARFGEYWPVDLEDGD